MFEKNKIFNLEKINEKSYICTHDKFTFIGEGDTPSNALKSFENQVIEYKEKLKVFKINELPKNPDKITRTPNISQDRNNSNNSNINLTSKTNWKGEIILHLIKSSMSLLIILLIIFTVITISSSSIKNSVDKRLNDIQFEISNFSSQILLEFRKYMKTNDSDMKLGEKLQKEIIRGSKTDDLDPETKRQLIESLDLTVDRYKPYIDSIKRLFAGDENEVKK